MYKKIFLSIMCIIFSENFAAQLSLDSAEKKLAEDMASMDLRVASAAQWLVTWNTALSQPVESRKQRDVKAHNDLYITFPFSLFVNGEQALLTADSLEDMASRRVCEIQELSLLDQQKVLVIFTWYYSESEKVTPGNALQKMLRGCFNTRKNGKPKPLIYTTTAVLGFGASGAITSLTKNTGVLVGSSWDYV